MDAFTESESKAGAIVFNEQVHARRDSSQHNRLRISPLFILVSLLTLAAVTVPTGAAEPPVNEAQGISLVSDAPESNVQDREVISLILGLAALPLLAIHWKRLVRFPGARWWIAALLTREVAWTVTVLESFFWSDVFDMTDHLFMTISTILAAIGGCILFHGTTKEPRTTS